MLRQIVTTLILTMLLAANILTAQESVGQGHRIRFRNAFDRKVARVAVGATEFFGVAPGETSDYQSIKEGIHTIDGALEGQGFIFLDGRIFIEPGVPRNWMLTLDANRRFVLAQEVESPSSQEGATSSGEQIAPQPSPPKMINLIRFINNYPETVVMMQMGPLAFRNIRPGQISGYQAIEPGIYQINGTIEGFDVNTLRGTLIIQKGANKRYTQTLTPAGTFNLIQE